MTLCHLKKLLFAFLFLMPNLGWASSFDETLSIRRIATCYHERDFELATELIDDFFREYPSTTHAENIYLLLADIYSQQRKWEKALITYQLLQDPSLAKDCMVQKLYCLYSLQRFKDLKESILPLLKEIDSYSKADQDLIHFYFAESLLKERKEHVELEVLNQAEKIYLSLAHSSYAPYVKISLAYLYSLQNHHEKAAALFAESAEHFLDIKEKLLFAAANQQSFFDIPLATQTFEHIKELHSLNQSDAFYNWMVLLFQSENFSKIIEAKDELLNQVPSARKANTYFLIGKAFYKEKNYPEALEHFELSLPNQTDLSDIKETLLLSVLSSYHLKDLAKLSLSLASLEKSFRNSIEHGEALLWKGKLLQEKKDFSKAILYFQRVIKLNFEKTCASAFYQLGVTYFLQSNFQKSYDYFYQLIEKHPQSAYQKSAVSYLVHAAINLYNKKESSKAKEWLIKAHLIALETKDFFREDQLPQVYLSLAKLYLDSNQLSQFNHYLDHFINQYSAHPLAYQAHLLSAFYYKMKQKDMVAYLESLEKTALSSPPIETASAVNADLFYGYLKQIKQSNSFENSYEKICNVAIRLIELNYLFPKNISLWFCQSLFQYVENKADKKDLHLEKVELILKYFLKQFSPLETLAEENILLNTAQVLGWQNKHQEKLTLLQNILDHFSKNHPLYVKALYQKGNCLEALSQAPQAMEAYEELLSSPGLSILEISLKAKHHLAQLFTLKYFKSPSPELSEKIQQLYQSLHVSRSFQNEPLHLEAALDFSLFTFFKDAKEENYSSFLNALIKIKTDFSLTDTLPAQEYHELRSKDPKKNDLFTQYMQYIDAKIAHLQAKIYFQKKELEKYEEKKLLSSKLLSYLMKTSLTPYLTHMCKLEQAYLNQNHLPDKFCKDSLIRETHHEL